MRCTPTNTCRCGDFNRSEEAWRAWKLASDIQPGCRHNHNKCVFFFFFFLETFSRLVKSPSLPFRNLSRGRRVQLQITICPDWLSPPWGASKACIQSFCHERLTIHKARLMCRSILRCKASVPSSWIVIWGSNCIAEVRTYPLKFGEFLQET